LSAYYYWDVTSEDRAMTPKNGIAPTPWLENGVLAALEICASGIARSFGGARKKRQNFDEQTIVRGNF
jgi:hypothetical protein